MLTPDEQDSYHLLALAESGRPVEQFAQFAASMFICGGLGYDEVLDYFSRVMARCRELLMDESEEIWPNLLPGGNQRPLETEEDRKASIFDDMVEAYEEDNLDFETIHDWISNWVHEHNPEPEPEEDYTDIVALYLPTRDEKWLVITKGGQFAIWDGISFVQKAPPLGLGEIVPGDIIGVEPSELTILQPEKIVREAFWSE